jgi:tRNA(Ile)-lysidine synthase
MASLRKSKASLKASKRIAVALSGGLDSVVLLDIVCKAQQANQSSAKRTDTKTSGKALVEVWAFHIHHGLQMSADQWLLFCEKLAAKYRIHFDFRLLHLSGDTSQGNIEARARAGRYEALTDLCIEYGITDLMLAHHQNDQAETILLQLLRGAGVAGLSGMPEQRLLDSEVQKISLKRPLLHQSRKELEAYAKKNKLKWIEDPSNQDTSYRRNAIRKEIIPVLEKIQPDAIANLARSAQLMADAQALLDRVAQQDGKAILNKNQLMLNPLLALAKSDLPAANNLVRYWLKSHQLAMPSQERLQSWWVDLKQVTSDSKLEWRHDDSSIRLWRGYLRVTKQDLDSQESGQWVFRPISYRSKTPGLCAEWVADCQQRGSIEVKVRQGSEKLQLKTNAPRKTLKNLFQERDIAPWLRLVPLLYIDGNLIAVAGLGVSYPHLKTSGKRVLPEWVQNPVK